MRSALAVKYREMNADGEMVGGPMYAMKMGLQQKVKQLATLLQSLRFSASFGIGIMTQANPLRCTEQYLLKSPILSQALWITTLALVVLWADCKSIGKSQEKVVPWWQCCISLRRLSLSMQNIYRTVYQIFKYVFRKGSSRRCWSGNIIPMSSAMRCVARGVFSNEAGLPGSLPLRQRQS